MPAIAVRAPRGRSSRHPVTAGSRRHAALAALVAFSVALAPLPAAAQQSGLLAGRVTEVGGGPLVGARVGIVGSRLGATTGADGMYRLRVEPGRLVVRTVFLGYAAHTDTVDVPAGGDARLDVALRRAPVALDQVVVLGSRAAVRTVTESPVPVDVLGIAEIEATGLTETAAILQRLAPSFNFPRPSITDGTDHVRPSTLRGLGPDQVLVLVNGKRRHTSALVNINGSIGRGSSGVDLNAIPASAIERIEVLRDGAAAQYGSDAIAGVINIVLKSDAERSVGAEYGSTAEGDGRVLQGDVNFGHEFAAGGSLHLTAELRDRNPTNRSRPDTRQQYFDGDPRNADPSLNGRVNHRYGDASTTDGILFGQLLRSIGGVEAYAFGGLGLRQGEAAGFFRRPNDDRTVRAIYPNGFLPLIETDILDGSLAAGGRGEAAGWRWDLGGVYGGNSLDYSVANSANVSLGTDSPTSFDAGSLTAAQGTINLDVSRPFIVGLRTPLNVAAGVEYRFESYHIEEGEEASWVDGGVPILDGPNAGNIAPAGAQVFPGFRPADAGYDTRSNVAAYADLEVNLTERLLVGVAGRFENYTDFGSTATGKLSARVELVRGLAIRGAAATGFRAPSLAQSFFSSTATNFINGQPFEIRTFPAGSAEGAVLGAEPLKAEESLNLSAGVAFKPSGSFSLTADFYHIEIDDRIVLSGNFLGAEIRQLFIDRGFTNVAGGRYFTNAIDTRTEGVDVVLNYGVLLGAGTLRFTSGYNWNKSRVLSVDPTPPELSELQNILFDRVERGRIEVGQPRDNLLLALNYGRGAFGANIATHRFGRVTNVGTTAANDQTFGAKWITDLDLSWSLMGARLSLGASNIFDVYPDEQIPANNFSGILPYSSITPFGFNGAYYYTRLSYDIR